MTHPVSNNGLAPAAAAQPAERTNLEQKTNQAAWVGNLFNRLKGMFSSAKIEKPVVVLAPSPKPVEAPVVVELPKEDPFKPYKVVIQTEACREVSYQIDSKEQEAKAMQELVALVEKDGNATVTEGLHAEWYYEIFPAARKVQEIFAAHFEIVRGKEEYSYSSIRPKILKQTELEGGRVRKEYGSGIVTEFVSKEKDRYEGIKRSPNGLSEEGIFNEKGELLSGVRQMKDKPPVFFHPDCLSCDGMIKGKPEFAVIKLDGEKVLALVQAEHLASPDYYLSDRNPMEALYQLCLSSGYFSSYCIESVFEHPFCKYEKRDFLDYVLEGNRLLELKESQLNTVLAWAKELGREIDPQLLPILFQKWVGEWRDELNKQLLELYPEGLRGEKSPGVSYFQYALQSGHAEGVAELLLEEMDRQQIPLSEADQWRKRAWRNEVNVAKESFEALDPQVQKEIYLMANLYGHTELLGRLKQWGMGEPALPIQGLGCLSPNMDFVDAFQAILNYLISLRKKGDLVTTAEWGEKDLSPYYTKTNDFGRVQGRDFIEETAKRLGLKSIKAPRKIVEVPNEQILFTVTERWVGIELKIDDGKADNAVICKTHADEIIASDRTVSREEMLELLTLLEATGYSDIHSSNFIVAADGIYIVDTEFSNFGAHPVYDMMDCLAQLLAREDREWFFEELDRRIELYSKKSETEAKAQQELYRQKGEEFGFGRRRVPFAYSMKDLA